ncbi:MAG: hypothetical protein R3F14_47070, partial [Polyangiaceae bacterium]
QQAQKQRSYLAVDFRFEFFFRIPGDPKELVTDMLIKSARRFVLREFAQLPDPTGAVVVPLPPPISDQDVYAEMSAKIPDLFGVELAKAW